MILDRLFKKRVIHNCEHEPYLYRWYIIRTARFGLFIHKFVRSDEDRALHDHPWKFLVIPIWRGYFEHNEYGIKRVRPILGIRFHLGDYRHRVELIKRRGGKELPSWSIFIRFARAREWGFWTPLGFVHWKHWWDQNCE